MKDYSKIREAIVSHLESRGDFDEAVDAITIDLLLFNLTVVAKCQEAIDREGVTIEGRFGTIQHPALNAYNAAVKQVAMLATKLGISRQERKKLKIAEEEAKDLFDSTFASLRN